MKKLLLLTMCFLLCALSGCSLMTDKVYGTIGWDADLLLVWDSGKDRGLLVEDAAALQELWDSYTWSNFHLECCVADPDFMGYVYRDGSRISWLSGHYDSRVDSYNPEFVRRLTALGNAEPNVYVTAATIPAGMQTGEAEVIAGARVLPRWEESLEPRQALLTAYLTTVLPESDEIDFTWHDEAELGDFDGDAAFLPLRDALQEAGVLHHTGCVRFRTASYMQPPEQDTVTRSVAFYLTGEPPFDSWEGFRLEYSPAKAWSALIVSEAPLTADVLARLAAAGVLVEGASGGGGMALGNPWQDVTEAELRSLTGVLWQLPEGADEVRWRFLPSQGLGEAQFCWNGWDCTARMAPADAETDISGMYFAPWDAEETGRVGGWEAVVRRDAAGPVSVCEWYDARQGRMYALSLLGEGADRADAARLAGSVFMTEGLASSLRGCTGYAGSAGASLKAAQAACHLLGFAVDAEASRRDAACLTAAAKGAWTMLDAAQQDELRFNLPRLNGMICAAFAGEAQGAAEDAGVAEELAALVLNTQAEADWTALYQALAQVCAVE